MKAMKMKISIVFIILSLLGCDLSGLEKEHDELLKEQQLLKQQIENLTMLTILYQQCAAERLMHLWGVVLHNILQKLGLYKEEDLGQARCTETPRTAKTTQRETTEDCKREPYVGEN